MKMKMQLCSLYNVPPPSPSFPPFPAVGSVIKMQNILFPFSIFAFLGLYSRRKKEIKT